MRKEKGRKKNEASNCDITLIDKNKPEAYKYAELQFKTLREAIRALIPYLFKAGFKVVA